MITFIIIAVFSNPQNTTNETSDNDNRTQEESSEGDKPIDDAIIKKPWVNDDQSENTEQSDQTERNDENNAEGEQDNNSAAQENSSENN